MAIEAVIFDFDGVIADSKKTIFRIYEAMCREMGLEFYNSLSDFLKNVDGNYMHFYMKLGIRKSEFERANRVYKKHFLRLGDGIEMFRGVDVLLHTLKSRDFKIGICSNTHEFIVNSLLKKFGVEKYVDAVVGGNDAEKLKPDPHIIVLAMKRMGVNPGHTAYVGDMEADMLAGKAANVRKLIAVTYGFHSKEMLERFDPDAVVDTPEEILGKL